MDSLHNLRIENIDLSRIDDITELADSETEQQILEKIRESFSLSQKNKIILGAFVNQKICGLIYFIFAEKRPWGSILYMKTKAPEPQIQLPVLTLLVDRCFQLAEENNCVRVYMVNNLKKRGNYDNARLYPLAKKIPRLKNYIFISESIVTADSRPDYFYEWQMMGFQTFDHDLGIVSATRVQNEIKI